MMTEAAGATILLADDEPAIRTLIEAALSAEGYRVLAPKNGYELLRTVQDALACEHAATFP